MQQHEGPMRGIKWSGKGAVPAVKSIVNVGVNRIGKSIVLGYFVEHGYLGLEVQPVDPPEWYVRQNGADTPCHVFGAELLSGEGAAS